ncbi:Hypothetical protein, putative [Bodo saltans]|uniref:Uncharacterized protein n=1 Tax=Bodo saltans TaxID=75058 RepID=A0A0S4J958_BODSA|nr:Hypothetical protein, putative [Bodo saltans]|eukprot:CUG74681.1 Hypothetical protein, putative [Bodo saltans]
MLHPRCCGLVLRSRALLFSSEIPSRQVLQGHTHKEIPSPSDEVVISGGTVMPESDVLSTKKAKREILTAERKALVLELRAINAAYANERCPKNFNRKKFTYICNNKYMINTYPIKNRIRELDSFIDVLDDDIWLKEPVAFHSISDAYESLRGGGDPVENPSGFRLSTKVLYNKKPIERALFAGIRKLMSLANTDATVREHFLVTPLGGLGLGKTDLLHRIRRDRTLQRKIAVQVNASNDGQVRCLRCVPLFASFDKYWWYDRDPADGPGLNAALCNMLLSDYLGVEFQKKLTRRCEGLTLRDLVKFVSEREAAKRNCDPNSVCVVVLVDEAKKLGDQRANTLCDELLAVQHSSMRAGLPMFAVAACVDVDSMFATVTRSSKHRLHPIPLYPCSTADIDDFVSKCCTESAMGFALPSKLPNDEIRADLTLRAHATKGNFELLSEILNRNKTPREECDYYFLHHSDPYAKEIIARQLLCNEEKCWMKETDLIGGRFGGHVTTLHNFVSLTLGVYYKEVDLTKSPPMVWPCVVPTYCTKRHVSESLQFLVKSLTDANLFMWCWAQALPQLEALASSMMRTMSGDMERLYHGVFVQHWDVKNPVPLTFRKACIDFEVCARRGSGEVRIVEELIASLTPRPHQPQYSHVNARGEVCYERNGVMFYRESRWRDPVLFDPEEVPPAIGGAHTLLEAPSGVDGVLKVVPVLSHLWLPRPGKDNEAELALLINRAHGHATLKLGLQPGSYFVALYVVSSLSGMSSTWKDSIPRGTIVIDAPSMERVMKPFGVDAEKLFECLRVVK